MEGFARDRLGRLTLAVQLLVERREPALLVPARVLADRLFCGYGELEDPIGAAGGL